MSARLETIETTYPCQNGTQEREDSAASIVVIVSQKPKHDGQNLFQKGGSFGADIVCRAFLEENERKTTRSLVMVVHTSTNFVNSRPRTLRSFPRASRYDSSPSSVSDPRSSCCARVLDSIASMTCPSESTLRSCNLSPGSLRPFEMIRNSATEVASRIG